MSSQHDIQAPTVYRFLRAVGRPFGVRWVGDYQLAVIYRLERYHTVKGPGFFRINPLTQRVHSIISVSPDLISTAIPGLLTKDALRLEFSMSLAYTCDPRIVPQDRAALVVKWSRDVRRAIVTDRAQRAFQAVVPQFYAEQICRGEVFQSLEDKFLKELMALVAPLALKPMFAIVKEVKVPPVLQSRFEAIVQRAINVQDISQYEPYELTQAMRTEALEAMQYFAGGKTYVDMPDMTDVVLPPQSELPPRRVTRPAATLDEPPSPEEPPASPSAHPGRRPRSRL